jgi:hypothetical protein
VSRKERSTSNLLPSYAKDAVANIYSPLFFRRGIRVSEDEEFIELASILGNENIFAARKEMFIEQDQYLNVDVHLSTRKFGERRK